MRVPRIQQLARWTMAIIAGVLACGNLLNAYINAAAMPANFTYWFTALMLIAWCVVEVALWRYGLQWLTRDRQLVKIRGLGWTYRLGIIGCLVLVWIPRFFEWRSSYTFEPEHSGETLIIVVPFFRPAGVADDDEAHRIQKNISDYAEQKGVANVRVELADGKQIRAEDRDTATALAQHYNASMIIWGTNTRPEITVNFLNLRQSTSNAPVIPIRETGEKGRTQLANPSAYAQFITQDLPKTMTFFSLFAVAHAAYMQRDYPAATHLTDTALASLDGMEQPPQGTADAYTLLGWLYQVPNHDTSSALNAYTKVIALTPKNADAYSSRASCYWNLGEQDEALADYNQAIALAPKAAYLFTNRGNFFRYFGEQDKALADYNQAIALDSNLAFAYSSRGDYFRDRGELEKALSDYNHAITLAPKEAQSYVARAYYYERTSEWDKALSDYTQAIALDPQKAGSAYSSRAGIYMRLGEMQKALADYNQAIALEPYEASYYYHRAFYYQKPDEQEKALADFNQAIALAPKEAYLYSGRAYYYKLIGELDKALADFNQAIAIDPKDSNRYVDLANFYADQKDSKKALANYNDAITLAPKTASYAYSSRASYYEQLGEWEKALADYNQAIALEPSNAEWYYSRGFIYTKLGERNAAISDFRKILNITKDSHLVQNAEGELKELGADK